MSVRHLDEPRSGRALLRVAYVDAPLESLLSGEDVLAVLGFGSNAPSAHADPRYFNTGLEVAAGNARFEVWRTRGPIQCGRSGDIAWARDGDLGFAALSVPEERFGGLAAAADAAYGQIMDFVEASPQRALLRVWNLVDAINQGAGDDERYRQFCLGRARPLQGRLAAYPAATAVGLADGRRELRIYWLAGAAEGQHMENPRQIAAWRYPRQYGPQPPSFSRATLAESSGVPLLVSGTASVVGHATVHPDDAIAQIGETLNNLHSLLQAARGLRPELPPELGAASLLKVYVRHARDADAIAALLDAQLPGDTARLLVRADICRADLGVEIDGFHG